MSTFFEPGADVQVRRVDERGDSLDATIAGSKGGRVVLAWKGSPADDVPGAGALVRIIRDHGDRQEAVTSQVAKVEASALLVVPKSKPVRYDPRQYLRVEANVPLSFKLVEAADVDVAIGKVVAVGAMEQDLTEHRQVRGLAGAWKPHGEVARCRLSALRFEERFEEEVQRLF